MRRVAAVAAGRGPGDVELVVVALALEQAHGIGHGCWRVHRREHTSDPVGYGAAKVIRWNRPRPTQRKPASKPTRWATSSFRRGATGGRRPNAASTTSRSAAIVTSGAARSSKRWVW